MEQAAGNISVCLVGCSLNGISITDDTIPHLFTDFGSACDYDTGVLDGYLGMNCEEVRSFVFPLPARH